MKNRENALHSLANSVTWNTIWITFVNKWKRKPKVKLIFRGNSVRQTPRHNYGARNTNPRALRERKNSRKLRGNCRHGWPKRRKPSNPSTKRLSPSRRRNRDCRRKWRTYRSKWIAQLRSPTPPKRNRRHSIRLLANGNSKWTISPPNSMPVRRNAAITARNCSGSEVLVYFFPFVEY